MRAESVASLLPAGCAGGLVKILPRAGAVVVAASWLVAVVLQSCSAAVAAHWLVAADSAAVVLELGLAAAVVVSELELVAAGAVAVVAVVEPAAAFQA